MKTPMRMLMTLGAAMLFAMIVAGPTMAEDKIISFNKATVEQLMAIESVEIPKELAENIVSYREKNGPFKRATDLLKVPGMTQDYLEELNPQEVDGDVVYDPDAPPALAPSKC
ncbi:competence protein ComEA helix-hairpin-helix repeat region [delta proteobacterium NaphS2]|nr:competence protein ComEA helix-hairpin-helix repeat region [delta proteobacterium NaphS2]